jgi:HSP20 family protein
MLMKRDSLLPLDPFSLFDSYADEFKLPDVLPAAPAVQIVERENEYELTVETPGLTRDDIKVDIEKGTLTLSGEKEVTVDSQTERVIRRERRAGSFKRSFRFQDIDEDKISATYENGLLTIVVPKAESAKPKQIEVK